MSIPQELQAFMAYGFGKELPPSEVEKGHKFCNDLTSEQHDKLYEAFKGTCEKYLDTESYKSGKTNTAGYIICCDSFGMCGMSGWMIFLIILIVLLCLAGAAAAFWFFYYKRKMGGRDEEKEIESTVDTANTGHDISVETY
ncbi:hypothetical protein GCK72_007768 [Caenorhabditis remanei]|uniref:Uncharacterized protein n=1 Tax=Caenorhabditis remanei TaxID=31234 RepID=A0A6A5HJY1_CAERE|nr:hypothetical protein GCK72_007768 [Caenorhabditis remanei]KAF1767809.1 hypothetical protein GCK72_007768 [Caenorhabditis remanei]